LDLSIVIINYRMGYLLEACFNSIYSLKHKIEYEVILINKPSDDGAEKICENYPGLKLVTFDTFGISVMRNEGIRHCKGRYILILDADTEVKEGSFDALVEFMDSNPEAGVAGGKTFRPNGSIEYSCKRFYTPLTILFRRTRLGVWFPNNRWVRWHLMLDEDHNTTLECDWVAGACFLIRRELFDDIGLFDNSFYFGFEDVDFCYRAKKAGWRVRYVPDCNIIHHVQRKSVGFNKLSFEHLKSGFHYLWKNKILRKWKRK
jgi:GT2 family glycosyltransferase